MNMSKNVFRALAVGVCFASVAAAQTIYVNNFGAAGWYSDDTRSDAGTNLIGLNYTHPSLQNGQGTEQDDLAISQVLSFTSSFSGAADTRFGLGALRINGGTQNAAKSTISIIDTATGFASASSMLSDDFYATYRAYNEPNPTTRTASLRFGIQSTKWSNSQNGFTAARTGEGTWDLILVYTGLNEQNAWTQHTLSATEGTWRLYFQAGNSYFGTRPNVEKTLAEWAADETYGQLLFGDGAVITNVQFGLGSEQRNNNTYIDYLQTNLLYDGGLIKFVDSSVSVEVTTPSSGSNDFTSETGAVIQLTTGGSNDAQVTVSNTGTSGEKTVVEVVSGAVVDVESLGVGDGGILAGGGVITAVHGVSVSDGGVHAPGFSPGVQVIAGDYTNTSELEIEIGGLTAATGGLVDAEAGQFDQLLVLGDVDLNGLTITVQAYEDFAPQVGDTFRFLYFNGDFAELTDGLTILAEGFDDSIQFVLNIDLDGIASFLGQGDLSFLALEVVAVPEPKVYAALFAAMALGVVMVLRRRK